jgi:hypothetical protein
MGHELTWLNNFDLPLQIDGRNVPVAGNAIHAKLTYLENMLRARSINMETIAVKEQELRKAIAELEEIKEFVPTPTSNRLFTLAIDLIHYLFLMKNYSNPKKVYNIFLAVIENKVTTAFDVATWDLIKRTFIDKLNQHLFDIGEDKNRLIIHFITTLEDAKINIASIMNDVKLIYEATQRKISSTWNKRADIEHKLETFLEGYVKRETNPALVEERIRILKQQIKELKEQKFCETVQENIVLAEIGFVVEVRKTPDAQTEFIPVHFPITTPTKNIHTIFEHFNQDYNYLAWTSDQKQIKRNSLIDAALNKQVGDQGELNKQGDYHSERDVYLLLQSPYFMNHLAKRLEKYFSGQKIETIRLVVLDMHSSRYMCARCQKATAFMQDPQGPFLKQLSAVLKKHFNNPALLPESGLHMITRVSADIPFPTQDKQVLATAHKSAEKISPNMIFSMDTRQIKLTRNVIATTSKNGLHQYTAFTSSENDDPTRNLILAHNHITAPIKNAAATIIAHAWKKHDQRKKLKANQVLTAETTNAFKLNI